MPPKCKEVFINFKLLKNVVIIALHLGLNIYIIYAKNFNLNYSPTLQKQMNAFKVIVIMNLIAAGYRFSL